MVGRAQGYPNAPVQVSQPIDSHLHSVKTKVFPAKMPVQAIKKPVQPTSTQPTVQARKRFKQPVQANLYDESLWRQKPGDPPMPRGFTCISHLLSEVRAARVIDGIPQIIVERVTGWQIQASIKCEGCNNRFRPVAGFISPRVFAKMKGESYERQCNAVKKAIESRFDSGRVSRRCVSCSVRDGGGVRSISDRIERNQKAQR